MAVLTSLTSTQIALTAFRVAALADNSSDFLRDMNLDEMELADALAFLDSQDELSRTQDVLDKPFEQKSLLREQSRFSDGSYSVLYGALERPTCAAEKSFHLTRLGCLPTYFGEFRYDFAGVTIDLRPLRPTYPDLTHLSDYSFCNALGQEAIGRSLDAFLTPSARTSDGTCLPVFRREAVSNPARIGLIRLP